MSNIFETDRLQVRKLKITDLQAMHKMQNNIKVMQYTTGYIKSLKENEVELNKVIAYYNKPKNNFWIYAVEQKNDGNFVGTIALVKDENNDDEIGFRFIEDYWNKGYGTEIVNGIIKYCKATGFKKLVANVVDKNMASAKIILKAGFKFEKKFVSDDLKLPETKYTYNL